MAEHKASAVLSGAIVTLAAALPLEAGAQSSSVTLYGRVNTTMEAIGGSPAFGVTEGAAGNTPVAQGDRHVHGNGWTVNAQSRLGVRGSEDLGAGLAAIFAIEAGYSDGSSTESGTVLPGTDRASFYYLDSLFPGGPEGLGLSTTGLTSSVTTDVRHYTGRAYYQWQSSVLSEPWSLWGRPSLTFDYDQTKINYLARLSSLTFGAAVGSNTTVNMRDRYYGIGGGYGFSWWPGFRPGAVDPIGQVFPALNIDTNVALVRRDSYVRNAKQENFCLVPPCGAAENFSTALSDPDNGWTWSARVRGELRLSYKTAPAATVFATVAGGWNYVDKVSRFNMPISMGSAPAHFDSTSGYQRYFGAGVGFRAAW